MPVPLDLHNPAHLNLVILIFIISYSLYFIIYKYLNWKKLHVKHLIFIILVLHFIFILIPFLTSNDIYSYIFQTRVFGVFKENTFLVPYDKFSFDPLYFHIKTVWSSETNLHGPLFVLIGSIINIIGKNNLIILVLLFKLTLISSNVLSAFLIYKITKSLKALYLYALNPLVIFELSGNAHADSLLILFMLLSFYYIKKGELAGILHTFFSALIKYSTLMFLPFQIIFLKNLGTKKLILYLLLCCFISSIIWLPFFEGLHIFDYLLSYYNGKFISPSLGILVLDKLLNNYAISFKINNIIFMAIYIFLSFRFFITKKSFEKLIFYLFIIFLVYLLTKLSLILVWDLTPLVALSVLCISFKDYKKWGFISLFFTIFYSLCLYWFIK